MIVKNCTLIQALSCEQETNLVDVAKILRDNKQRRIIVTDHDKPVGIISTTDMNNKVVAENKLPNDLKAKEIMTSPLFLACDWEDDLTQIYKKMLEHKTYFVPVTKEGKLYAVLTYGELKKRVLERIEND